MHSALVKFDLMPLQVAQLECSQAVAIGDQEHRCIAVAVSAVLAGSVHQALDLALGKITASNCEV
jgi:hypothetical protein